MFLKGRTEPIISGDLQRCYSHQVLHIFSCKEEAKMMTFFKIAASALLRHYGLANKC